MVFDASCLSAIVAQGAYSPRGSGTNGKPRAAEPDEALQLTEAPEPDEARSTTNPCSLPNPLARRYPHRSRMLCKKTFAAGEKLW